MASIEDLSVADALAAVLKGVSVMETESVPISNALNRVLVKPVLAQDSLPPFANSSMDGYALRSVDVGEADKKNPVTLNVVDDIPAGNVSDRSLTKGTAARIMTGAPLPEGADAVVPVEDTSEPWRDDQRQLPKEINIFRSVNYGDYVRWPGEDIVAGETVIPSGKSIRAQEIGVMASLGVTKVSVVRPPKVGILATGDELISVGDALSPGKIRNSNSYAQAAQVMEVGAIPIPLGVAGDSEGDVREKLNDGLQSGVDLFISSAGVSVGAYDVVKAVLEAEGNVGFWRVRMRPGKPLAFGHYAGVPYLGLPGNPVSAMVSFERFARPAILRMSGYKNLNRPTVTVTMIDDISSDGRESYVRAIVKNGPEGYQAVTTGQQGSHIMTSLVKANALVIIPEGKRLIRSGEQVTAMMVDWPNSVF